jgi:hypothetical protein
MSDPNVKIGFTQSTGLAARYRQHRIARRAGDEQEPRSLAPLELSGSPFRLCSRGLTTAARSRSGRREDDVEADPRPGTVREIAALGRGRARGPLLEVLHQGVPDVLLADHPRGREVLAALSQILEIRGHLMSRAKFGRMPASPAGVKTTCTGWSQAM